MRPVLKRIDAQGRIVVPASWRRKHVRGDRVLVRPRGDVLELIPQKEIDLTAYFDAAEVDLKADLSDWHAVQRELRKR